MITDESQRGTGISITLKVNRPSLDATQKASTVNYFIRVSKTLETADEQKLNNLTHEGREGETE